MDGQSREDVERRLIEAEAVVERCMCEKTGKKKPVIRGYAALFQSDSQDLGGFVERVLPGAFDGVIQRGTDVVALYNHDPMFLLGRESSGTLRLSVDERGLRYEIDPPESRADVIEAIERGDVRGSSFAFKVKGAGEKWSRMADGRQLREIREIDGLFDVGPVLKPAYSATESFVSRRALEIANATDVPVEAAQEEAADEADDSLEAREEEVGLKPTAGMAAAARRGLKLHEEGKSGDGLKPETVARANKIAKREELTEDHVREMNGWFARHESDKREGWDKVGEETPGFVAWLLWGGDAGKNWSARKSAAMENDRSAEQVAEVRDTMEAEDIGPEQGSLSAANYALYEALEKIAEENGQWPQAGADGAHYMEKSPFAKDGMRCRNCIFWNPEGNCDIVAGQIAEEGLCKLWVIPEEKLVASGPEPAPAEDAKRSADNARIKAMALELARHGHKG
jgi:HK97 family phage prohead protease